MGVPTISTAPMNVEEFYAFTDTRPDEEKWELIDGEPILNAAPSPTHQVIVGNLLFALKLRERELEAPWAVLPGLGVRISPENRPEPDIIIIPRHSRSLDLQGRDRNDVIVTFEVLSPSTRDRDLRWKRNAYLSLPSLTHYVVVAQDAVDAVVFDRKADALGRHFNRLDQSIDLSSIGVSLPMAEIYRDTGLGSH